MNDDDLILLGKIRPGETINISTREIVVHRSWYACGSRWWNLENRNLLPNWIENIFKNEINQYSKMFRRDLMDSQRDKILMAISGVRNLCVTYIGDPISERLRQIIHRVEEILFKINHPATQKVSINKNNSENSFWPFPSTY